MTGKTQALEAWATQHGRWRPLIRMKTTMTRIIAAYLPWQTPRLRPACADKAPSLGAGEMTGRQAHGAAWLLGDGRDPRTSAEAKAVKVLDWDAEHKNQPEQ